MHYERAYVRKFPLIMRIYLAKVKLKAGYVIKAINFNSDRLYNGLSQIMVRHLS
jgi:hypothetical protein